MDAQNTRLTSLEARVAALESGAVSVSTTTLSLSTSTIVAGALQGFSGILHIGELAANAFYAARGFIDHLTAGNLAVGTASAPAGVTLYDTVTKQPYCFSVADGAPTTTPGACLPTAATLDPFATTATATAPAASGPLTVTLNGANPTYLAVGSTYVEQGAVVAGGSDGTAPYGIYVNGGATATSSPFLDTSAPTTYILTYTARDSAGDTASVTRSVIVGNPDGTVSTSGTTSTATTTTTATSTATSTTADTTPPVVTLNGSATVQLMVGDTWTDPGATALDNVDGDLTAKIVTIGSVDTATAGTYAITYSATDSAGNTGSATRTVSVAASSTATAATTSTGTATSTSTTTTSTTTSTTTTSS